MSAAYTSTQSYILAGMTKHLVDIDEAALRSARAKLGTTTIKDTVNHALQQASGDHARETERRLDALARADVHDREHAWR